MTTVDRWAQGRGTQGVGRAGRWRWGLTAALALVAACAAWGDDMPPLGEFTPAPPPDLSPDAPPDVSPDNARPAGTGAYRPPWLRKGAHDPAVCPDCQRARQIVEMAAAATRPANLVSAPTSRPALLVITATSQPTPRAATVTPGTRPARSSAPRAVGPA